MLSINFSTVGNIEDSDTLFAVFNRVNNSIISDSKTVKNTIAKFLTSKRSWAGFKRKEFWKYSVLKDKGEFLKLALSASRYLYRVLTQFLRPFLRFLTKVRSFLYFSEFLFMAVARSIMSSLKEWSFIIVNRKAFCSCLGSALKAVKNISTVACLEVILVSPIFKKTALHKARSGLLITQILERLHTCLPSASPRGEPVRQGFSRRYLICAIIKY